jgi:nucleotide-binding universal stress UspA family protein
MISVAESGEEGVVMATRKQTSKLYEIVVPTDFSSGSTRAMAFALSLAGCASRVTAVHAVDPLPYRFGTQELSNLKRQQAWAMAQHSMARWLQQGKFCECDNMVIEGDPALAIVKFAAAKGADFIVLATSARRHAARFLLGSVAEEIFRDAKCPVVVLGPRARLLKKRNVARLVFATDLAPHSLAALAQLSAISNALHSKVSVIRAIPRAMEFPGERNRVRKETRETFDAAADRKLRKHTNTISIVFGSPVKAITNFARRTTADAIVMGIRGGGELSRAATHIPWALAHRVIAEAKCPVMTIRG